MTGCWTWLSVALESTLDGVTMDLCGFCSCKQMAQSSHIAASQMEKGACLRNLSLGTNSVTQWRVLATLMVTEYKIWPSERLATACHLGSSKAPSTFSCSERAAQ